MMVRPGKNVQLGKMLKSSPAPVELCGGSWNSPRGKHWRIYTLATGLALLAASKPGTHCRVVYRVCQGMSVHDTVNQHFLLR